MAPMTPDEISKKADAVGILPSHDLKLNIPYDNDSVRPPNIRHMYGICEARNLAFY